MTVISSRQNRGSSHNALLCQNIDLEMKMTQEETRLSPSNNITSVTFIYFTRCTLLYECVKYSKTQPNQLFVKTNVYQNNSRASSLNCDFAAHLRSDLIAFPCTLQSWAVTLVLSTCTVLLYVCVCTSLSWNEDIINRTDKLAKSANMKTL